MGNKKSDRENEEKVLLFSSGMIFAVGMSASLVGQVVPAMLMGFAVLVCLSLVDGNKTKIQKRA